MKARFASLSFSGSRDRSFPIFSPFFNGSFFSFSDIGVAITRDGAAQVHQASFPSAIQSRPSGEGSCRPPADSDLASRCQPPPTRVLSEAGHGMLLCLRISASAARTESSSLGALCPAYRSLQSSLTADLSSHGIVCPANVLFFFQRLSVLYLAVFGAPPVDRFLFLPISTKFLLDT